MGDGGGGPNRIGAHEMGAPCVFLAPGEQGGTPGWRGLLGSMSPASGDVSHGVDTSLGVVDAWGDVGDASRVVHGGWANGCCVRAVWALPGWCPTVGVTCPRGRARRHACQRHVAVVAMCRGWGNRS